MLALRYAHCFTYVTLPLCNLIVLASLIRTLVSRTNHHPTLNRQALATGCAGLVTVDLSFNFHLTKDGWLYFRSFQSATLRAVLRAHETASTLDENGEVRFVILHILANSF